MAALSIAIMGAAAMSGGTASALTPVSPEEIAAPSGQVVLLNEIILDAPGPDGPITHYRYFMPGIARDGGPVGFAQAADDLQYLCDSAVVPDLALKGPLPDAVILSAADRVVAFGDTDPDATQFFTAFDIVDGRCILEPF